MAFKKAEQYFVNTLILLLMLLIYALFAMHFLPDGINQVFATWLWKRILILLTISYFCFFMFILLKKDKSFRYLKKIDKMEWQEIVLFLLPITPVIQYIILNHEILSIADSCFVVSFFAALILIFGYAIPWTLSIVASKEFLMAIALCFLFVIFNMSLLASSFKWHLSGDPLIQSSILLAAITVILCVRIAGKKFLYIVIGLFFLVNSISSVIEGMDSGDLYSSAQDFDSNSELYNYTKNKEIANKKSVFLLVYESYSNQETMNWYGYDNSEQILFLKNLGFSVYPGAYSIGANTLRSMSRMLNASSHLEKNARYYTAGSAAVPDILSRNGYKTVGLFYSDYPFRGRKPAYEYYLPEHSVKPFELLTTSILEGEFRFDAEFDTLDYSDYLAEKKRFLSKSYSSPIFLYAHNKYPGHSQNSGECRPNETELHLEKIKKANKEMRKDVKNVINANPNSIIVIAGDHGPYLTKNCTALRDYDDSEIDRYDVQDRYGAFLAIRWPEDVDTEKFDIQILQDVFPAVMAHLYDNDEILNAKVQRKTIGPQTGQVRVDDGIIYGGRNDGDPLFNNSQTR